MLNGTLSFLQKYLFLLLSFQFCNIDGTCSQNVQLTSKLSPQNHFITKHILFLKQFHQLSRFVNTLHMVCSIHFTMPTK